MLLLEDPGKGRLLTTYSLCTLFIQVEKSSNCKHEPHELSQSEPTHVTSTHIKKYHVTSAPKAPSCLLLVTALPKGSHCPNQIFEHYFLFHV